MFSGPFSGNLLQMENLKKFLINVARQPITIINSLQITDDMRSIYSLESNLILFYEAIKFLMNRAN